MKQQVHTRPLEDTYTVQDLIEELRGLDPNMPVYLCLDTYNLHGEKIIEAAPLFDVQSREFDEDFEYVKETDNDPDLPDDFVVLCCEM